MVGMGAWGLNLGANSEVTNVKARWNRLDGISAGIGSTISDNTSYQNGDDGIFAGNGSVIRDNSVYGNLGIGIITFEGSTISGNSVTQNGGDGISDASGGCLIERNAVRGNTGFGLNLKSDTGYRANVISGNTAGSTETCSLESGSFPSRAASCLRIGLCVPCCACTVTNCADMGLSFDPLCCRLLSDDVVCFCLLTFAVA